jgi:hypothetical protein
MPTGIKGTTYGGLGQRAYIKDSLPQSTIWGLTIPAEMSFGYHTNFGLSKGWVNRHNV